MVQVFQFNRISTLDKIDADSGVIFGVSVICKGEAKGHNGLQIDNKALTQFLDLAREHKNGIKIRFGQDHDSGASDIAGILKNFRRDGDTVRADLHLLKADKHFHKIIEMAATMPEEFGLSASTAAIEEQIGPDKFVRFTDIFSVDIVSNPAATNGLFFDTNSTIKTPMLKELAIKLGIAAEQAEQATEQELLVAFEACSKKMKADAESEAKKKFQKKLDAEADSDADADDEEKAKQGKKFSELEDKIVKLVQPITEKLTELEKKSADTLELARKSEIDGLIAEASRDGKVIPLSNEQLYKMETAVVKCMISKLPAGQVKMSRKTEPPKGSDGKVLDRNSAEFKAYIEQRKAEGAIALGQRILSQMNLN